MTVDFWFDPGCPWTWITSRWLADVAGRRGLDVRWRTFSLAEKNKGTEVPERARAAMAFGVRSLRVAEAVRADAGEAAVGDLYAELGRRLHHEGEKSPDLADALSAAGLDPSLAAAADDEALDDIVRASMEEGLGLVGDDVGVPIIAFPTEGGVKGFSGPVISPAPTGEAADRLYDAVEVAATTDGFFELKRARVNPPIMPA